MSTLYTSYDTSLRLKQAGAPQDGAERMWYWNETRHEWRLANQDAVQPDDPGDPCRAFRADEIIEALGICLSAIYRSVTGCFDVHYELLGLDLEPVFTGSIERDTLVEALAAAWIAVLEEQK
jgi:hypothetical protein